MSRPRRHRRVQRLASAALLALALAQGVHGQNASELAADGRFAEAWDAANAVENAIERSRLRSSVLFSAGDLGQTLAEAEAGLVRDSGHLELLFYATSVSLTLGDAERGRQYVSRFAHAVRERTNDSNRAAWEGWSEEFAGRARRLDATTESSQRALQRARICVAIGTAIALVVLYRATRAS